MAQGKPGVLIPITNAPALLSEVLQNEVSTDPETTTQISLQRDDRTYGFSLDDAI